MAESAQILPGTLDLLILKAVSLGRLHGYGVLLRIEQISTHRPPNRRQINPGFGALEQEESTDRGRHISTKNRERRDSGIGRL